MPTTYEQLNSDFGVGCLKRIDEEGIVTFIPMNEGNSDYQQYLVWLEEQK